MTPMRRVVVRGSSGAGKSTVAVELGRRLGVPAIELDALYHQAGWEPLANDDLRRAVDVATRGDGWVVDGNYRVAMEVVRPRADTLVWLDLPRPLVMRRVLGRSVWRGLARRELWNGNRERLSSLFRRDPEANIVLWSWTTFDRHHAEAMASASDPAWAHASVVRLTSPSAVTAFLAEASAP